MKKLLCLLFLITLIISLPVNQSVAKDDPWDMYNFWAYCTMGTDYINRGVSRTDSENSIEGMFTYRYRSFLGAISINVVEETTEWDFNGDYNDSFGPVDYNIGLHYYHYPDTGPDQSILDEKLGGAGNDRSRWPGWKKNIGYDYEWDYGEGYLKLSHEFKDINLKPKPGFNMYYSPQYWKDDGFAITLESDVTLTLPVCDLNLLYGYTDVEGDSFTGNGTGLDGLNGYAYSYWKIGVSNTWKYFIISLDYWNNSEPDFRGINTDESFVFSVEFYY